LGYNLKMHAEYTAGRMEQLIRAEGGGNVVITTHTYTPNRMAKMGVAIERACDLCEEEMGI
jgi:hypothetical protein